MKMLGANFFYDLIQIEKLLMTQRDAREMVNNVHF